MEGRKQLSAKTENILSGWLRNISLNSMRHPLLNAIKGVATWCKGYAPKHCSGVNSNDCVLIGVNCTHIRTWMQTAYHQPKNIGGRINLERKKPHLWRTNGIMSLNDLIGNLFCGHIWGRDCCCDTAAKLAIPHMSTRYQKWLWKFIIPTQNARWSHGSGSKCTSHSSGWCINTHYCTRWCCGSSNTLRHAKITTINE